MTDLPEPVDVDGIRVSVCHGLSGRRNAGLRYGYNLDGRASFSSALRYSTAESALRHGIEDARATLEWRAELRSTRGVVC